jgi:hypothetical protein
MAERGSQQVSSLLATITNKHNLHVESDIEKYIKAEAFLEQFRIKDFFEDFDKLRKGYVTEDKVACDDSVPFGPSSPQDPSHRGPDSDNGQQVQNSSIRSYQLCLLLRYCRKAVL